MPPKTTVQLVSSYQFHIFTFVLCSFHSIFHCFHSIPGGGWDLTQYKTFTICKSTITSMCMVGKWLWLATGHQCYVFNMKTHKIEVCVCVCVCV